MRAPSVPDLRLGERGRLVALPVLVAAPLFALAYANGGFGIASRSVAAMVVWWVIALALVLRVWPLERPPRVAVLAGGLLAGYAGLVLASSLWADGAEAAFVEANRATLLLGVFVIGVAASRRGHAGAWTDGLALATAAIGAVALASRFFPGLFPDRGLTAFLPVWQERLSFPLGYWNGLAIFVALGVPPLLRRACEPGSAAMRGLAVAALPQVGAVAFLCASRGGFATAVAGAVAFLALSGRRWAAAGAVAAGGAGAALAVVLLERRDELVNGPLAADAVESQGRSAAVWLVVVSLAVGAAYAAAVHVLANRRPPARAGLALTATAAVVALGLFVAFDPRTRFDEFRQPPRFVYDPRPNFVQTHVLSARGNGRWQFWGAAVDEGRAHPFAGDGAGAFAAWWARHRDMPLFVRDAHSLYFETFAELGIVGLALVVGFVAVVVAEGVRRARALPDLARESAAALTALGIAFAFAAGIDWVWDLSAVSALAVLALGVLVGPATAVSELRPRPSAALGGALVAVAWLVIVLQGISFITQFELERSAQAVDAGDAAAALDHVRAARAVQPWASSPWERQALIEERLGVYGRARRSIGEAIERDPENWRLWLIRARLEARDADVPAARRSLARFRTLNPSSTINGLLQPP